MTASDVTRGTRPTRPLSAVLEAVRRGASSLPEVERATGLSGDVVEGAVAHLVRLGRLVTEQVTFGCPASGCGSCLAARRPVFGSPTCGLSGPSTQGRGLVLVSLRVP